MNQTKRYILHEAKIIEKECREKGISASEWIERYAEDYHRKYSSGSMQKGNMLKKEVSR